MTPRRLALLVFSVALFAACAHAPVTEPVPGGGRDEASYAFPRAFDETRAAALDALRSVANAVLAGTAHLEGVLPAAGGAPETRIDVWLRTDGTQQTVVLVQIARPVPTPIVPPGQVSGDGFLHLVARRLDVEPPRRTGGAEQIVAPPAAVPGGDGRGGYGWATGPLGPPALRGIAAVGYEKAFRSATFREVLTDRPAYAHLDEGLRVQAGVSVPNDAGGRLDTRLTVGALTEAGTRDLAWRSFPVELVETLTSGAVRTGVGVVQHLGARAVGSGGFRDVSFRASPGVVARVGMVVPTGKVRSGVSSGLVVDAHASWVRLSAEGRRFDATSGGVSLAWMF